MIEKIKDLNWHYQLILLVVVATLLYLTVWYFFTSVTRAEVQVLEDEIAEITKKNEEARIATQRVGVRIDCLLLSLTETKPRHLIYARGEGGCVIGVGSARMREGVSRPGCRRHPR